MKTLFVNQNVIVLILTVMLLTYSVQGISYGQGKAPTFTPGETNTSLVVNFRITLDEGVDENAYQIQLRQKNPQGEWITKCVVIERGEKHSASYRSQGETGKPDVFVSSVWNSGGWFQSGWYSEVTFNIEAIFTGLEPATTYEAHYRDTNLDECTQNPPAPDPWSEIGEGVTHDVITEPGGRTNLYFINDESIHRVSNDGTHRSNIVIGLSVPRGIAVDIATGKIYWTDAATKKIQRANLDGSNVETVVENESRYPRDIAVDIAGGKIYWADSWDGKIQRANLNGADIQNVLTGLVDPEGIALDIVQGKIYWIDRGTDKIQRANLDGTNIQDVVIGMTNLRGIALSLTLKFSRHTTVTFSPAASPAVGKQLEISLNITGGEAVAGYQATVQFDETALRYVSGANGDYLPAGAFFAEPKVEGNLVKLNAASLAGESNGDGTLATLTFEVVAVKASTLTLSDVLLSNSAGETFVPKVENALITEPTGLEADVNGDGTVNIADLVLVASNLGKTGQNAADVNGDNVVNIADLVLVAGALGDNAAAPSLHPQALEMLTATEVKQWLSAAQRLNLTDPTSQRGILFLQQLLTALIPKETTLLANYPNPFNPETWIPYHLSKDADVTLHIYAVNGQLVRTLSLGHQPAGMYQNRSRAAYWDGKNAFGEPVASGVYFYKLTAGDFTATRKMLIRK